MAPPAGGGKFSVFIMAPVLTFSWKVKYHIKIFKKARIFWTTCFTDNILNTCNDSRGFVAMENWIKKVMLQVFYMFRNCREYSTSSCIWIGLKTFTFELKNIWINHSKYKVQISHRFLP